MKLILCACALLLGACSTTPPQTADRTSHPCPAFGQAMDSIETTLNGRAGT